MVEFFTCLYERSFFRKDPESGDDNSDTDKRDEVVDPRDIYSTATGTYHICNIYNEKIVVFKLTGIRPLTFFDGFEIQWRYRIKALIMAISLFIISFRN